MTDQDPFKIISGKIGSNDLSGLYRERWVEESFDVDKNDSNQLGTSHTRTYLGIIITRTKIFAFFVCIAFCFGIIFLDAYIFDGNS